MMTFNLKGEVLVQHPPNDEAAPGRTILPGPLRMAEPGWPERSWMSGEAVVRGEGDVKDDELRAAREWLRHVEAGRIGAAP